MDLKSLNKELNSYHGSSSSALDDYLKKPSKDDLENFGVYIFHDGISSPEREKINSAIDDVITSFSRALSKQAKYKVTFVKDSQKINFPHANFLYAEVKNFENKEFLRPAIFCLFLSQTSLQNETNAKYLLSHELLHSLFCNQNELQKQELLADANGIKFAGKNQYLEFNLELTTSTNGLLKYLKNPNYPSFVERVIDGMTEKNIPHLENILAEAKNRDGKTWIGILNDSKPSDFLNR